MIKNILNGKIYDYAFKFKHFICQIVFLYFSIFHPLLAIILFINLIFIFYN
jgi:hypothetical protein